MKFFAAASVLAAAASALPMLTERDQQCNAARAVSIIIDSSASNRGTDPQNLRLSASGDLVNHLNFQQDRVSIVSFNDEATLRYPLGQDKNAAISAIQQVNARGNTKISEGLARGLDQVINLGQDARDHAGLVVFTDGLDNTKAEQLKLINRAKDAGIRVSWGHLSSSSVQTQTKAKRDVEERTFGGSGGLLSGLGGLLGGGSSGSGGLGSILGGGSSSGGGILGGILGGGSSSGSGSVSGSGSSSGGGILSGGGGIISSIINMFCGIGGGSSGSGSGSWGGSTGGGSTGGGSVVVRPTEPLDEDISAACLSTGGTVSIIGSANAQQSFIQQVIKNGITNSDGKCSGNDVGESGGPVKNNVTSLGLCSNNARAEFTYTPESVKEKLAFTIALISTKNAVTLKAVFQNTATGVTNTVTVNGANPSQMLTGEAEPGQLVKVTINPSGASADTCQYSVGLVAVSDELVQSISSSVWQSSSSTQTSWSSQVVPSVTPSASQPPAQSSAVESQPPAQSSAVESQPPAQSSAVESQPPVQTSTWSEPPAQSSAVESQPPVQSSTWSEPPAQSSAVRESQPPVQSSAVESQPPASSATWSEPPTSTTETAQPPASSAVESQPPVQSSTWSEPPAQSSAVESQPPAQSSTWSEPPAQSSAVESQPPVQSSAVESQPPTTPTESWSEPPPTATLPPASTSVEGGCPTVSVSVSTVTKVETKTVTVCAPGCTQTA